MVASLKHLLVAGIVATLASFADAHSALLANGKLLGKLNSGSCFNCAVGSYPVPADIPASAVDAADPEDGIGAYIKSSGKTVKDVWASFHAGTPYGGIVEPEAIQAGTCGRYSPTAIGDVPAGADITYKKSNHNGPGEIWVDGVKTWFGTNFITDGGSITADAFKCTKASCNVTWYWIGKVRVKGAWNYYQLYVQCFVVKGSGSGAAGDADSDTPAETPAPAPATDDEGDATPATVAPPNTDAATPKPTKTKKTKKPCRKLRIRAVSQTEEAF